MWFISQIYFCFGGKWRFQILRPDVRKLGLKISNFEGNACLKYKARRYPHAISLFYNFSRFYIVISMTFENNFDIVRDLKEIPRFLYGIHYPT